MRHKPLKLILVLFLAGFTAYSLVPRTLQSQDWFSTGINLGAPRIRLAVSEFQPQSVNQDLVRLTQEFQRSVRRAVIHDYDLEVAERLVAEARQQLPQPAQPVPVYDDDACERALFDLQRRLRFDQSE